MIRLLASTVVALIANAIALIVGAWVLPGMTLSSFAFVIAVVIFTVATILLDPLIRQVAMTKTPVLIGSSALISTLLALIVTAIVSDGLRIEGITTWILATVIVWAVALIARLLLPFIVFKKTLAKRAER
ncbi:phage holin family protein [Rhodococcus sp. NPDC060086]|uniref:phage holin family protein n=1 Tax=Rhodococcus sp. NPDC060086 TaxID=3347055 RepID=UPI003663A5DD